MRVGGHARVRASFVKPGERRAVAAVKAQWIGKVGVVERIDRSAGEAIILLRFDPPVPITAYDGRVQPRATAAFLESDLEPAAPPPSAGQPG